LGAAHGCALFANGDLRCWGDNTLGQLGIGDYSGPDLEEPIPLTLSGVSDFSSGYAHTCALVGSQWLCWGLMYKISSVEFDFNPFPIELGTSIQRIRSGPTSYEYCAIVDSLDPDRQLKCWGRFDGTLGMPGPSDPADLTSYPLFGAGAPLVDVQPGYSHFCALVEDDGSGVRCWGSNQFGQVGVEGCDDDLCLIPTPVSLGNDFEVRAIGVGQEHNCALSTEGEVKCWGNGVNGRLGIGSTESRGRDEASMGNSLPPVLLGARATAIAVGAAFSCALLENGAVKCWGDGSRGQLGQPMLTGSHDPDTADDVPGTNDLGDDPDELGDNLPPIDLGGRALEIRAGGSFACAILETREVKCWGDNSRRQLGVVTESVYVGDEVAEMGEALRAIRFR